jgi:hypothetical protein
VISLPDFKPWQEATWRIASALERLADNSDVIVADIRDRQAREGRDVV